MNSRQKQETQNLQGPEFPPATRNSKITGPLYPETSSKILQPLRTAAEHLPLSRPPALSVHKPPVGKGVAASVLSSDCHMCQPFLPTFIQFKSPEYYELS